MLKVVFNAPVGITFMVLGSLHVCIGREPYCSRCSYKKKTSIWYAYLGDPDPTECPDWLRPHVELVAVLCGIQKPTKHCHGSLTSVFGEFGMALMLNLLLFIPVDSYFARVFLFVC